MNIKKKSKTEEGEEEEIASATFLFASPLLHFLEIICELFRGWVR